MRLGTSDLAPIFNKDRSDVNGQIALTQTCEQVAPKAIENYAGKNCRRPTPRKTNRVYIDAQKVAAGRMPCTPPLVACLAERQVF